MLKQIEITVRHDRINCISFNIIYPLFGIEQQCININSYLRVDEVHFTCEQKLGAETQQLASDAKLLMAVYQAIAELEKDIIESIKVWTCI